MEKSEQPPINVKREEIFSKFYSTFQTTQGILQLPMWKLFLRFIYQNISEFLTPSSRPLLLQMINLVRTGLPIHSYSWKLVHFYSMIDSRVERSLNESGEVEDPTSFVALSQSELIEWTGCHPKSSKIWKGWIEQSFQKKDFISVLNISELISSLYMKERQQIIPYLEETILPSLTNPTHIQILNQNIERMRNDTFSVSCRSDYKTKLQNVSSIPPNQLIKELSEIFINEIQKVNGFMRVSSQSDIFHRMSVDPLTFVFKRAIIVILNLSVKLNESSGFETIRMLITSFTNYLGLCPSYWTKQILCRSLRWISRTVELILSLRKKDEWAYRYLAKTKEMMWGPYFGNKSQHIAMREALDFFDEVCSSEEWKSQVPVLLIKYKASLSRRLNDQDFSPSRLIYNEAIQKALDLELPVEIINQLWEEFAQLEIDFKQNQYAKLVYERAVTCDSIYRHSYIWKKYIEFSKKQGKLAKVRKLYQRALRKVQDGELWDDFLNFERKQTNNPSLTKDQLKSLVNNHYQSIPSIVKPTTSDPQRTQSITPHLKPEVPLPTQHFSPSPSSSPTFSPSLSPPISHSPLPLPSCSIPNSTKRPRPEEIVPLTSKRERFDISKLLENGDDERN